jgi:hypothetical protein
VGSARSRAAAGGSAWAGDWAGCSWSWMWARVRARCRGPGGLRGVADGGVIVLVDLAGVHVLLLLAMPQLPGEVGMLVLTQLSVVAVGVGLGEPPPAWPCLPEPTQLPGSGIPVVDRQVDRQRPRLQGSTADSPGRLYTS